MLSCCFLFVSFFYLQHVFFNFIKKLPNWKTVEVNFGSENFFGYFSFCFLVLFFLSLTTVIVESIILRIT